MQLTMAFRNFWLKDDYMKIFNNLFDDASTQIRTTNHVEGYHATLKFHYRTKMGLGEWLNVYRNLANLEQETGWAVHSVCTERNLSLCLH